MKFGSTPFTLEQIKDYKKSSGPKTLTYVKLERGFNLPFKRKLIAIGTLGVGKVHDNDKRRKCYMLCIFVAL